MSSLTTRTCSVCIKFNKPLADCPHPGRIVKNETGLTKRDIVYRVGVSVTCEGHLDAPCDHPAPAGFRWCDDCWQDIAKSKPTPKAFKIVLRGHHCPIKWLVDANDGRFEAHVPFTSDEMAIIRPITWKELWPVDGLAAAQERGEASLKELGHAS